MWNCNVHLQDCGRRRKLIILIIVFFFFLFMEEDWSKMAGLAIFIWWSFLLCVSFFSFWVFVFVWDYLIPLLGWGVANWCVLLLFEWEGRCCSWIKHKTFFKKGFVGNGHLIFSFLIMSNFILKLYLLSIHVYYIGKLLCLWNFVLVIHIYKFHYSIFSWKHYLKEKDMVFMLDFNRIILTYKIKGWLISIIVWRAM